jgi:fatty-acyl-CoA synthase
MTEQDPSPQTTGDVEGSKEISKTSRLSIHSTYDLIREVAVRDPEKTAIVLLAGGGKVDEPEQRISYGALLNGIRQTANLLTDLCVEPGDVIALLLPNLLETHLLLWGGQTVGIVCPVPPGFSVEQAIALLRVAKAKVLVAPGREVSQDLWQRAEDIRRGVKSITLVLQVRGLGKERDAVYAFNALLGDYSASRLHIRRAVAPDDIAVALPVRSVTNTPSLVSLTHGELLYLAWAIGRSLMVAPEDVLLGSLWPFMR